MYLMVRFVASVVRFDLSDKTRLVKELGQALQQPTTRTLYISDWD